MLLFKDIKMQKTNKYQADREAGIYPEIPATYMNRQVRRALQKLNHHLVPKIWDQFFRNMATNAAIKPKETE